MDLFNKKYLGFHFCLQREFSNSAGVTRTTTQIHYRADCSTPMQSSLKVFKKYDQSYSHANWVQESPKAIIDSIGISASGQVAVLVLGLLFIYLFGGFVEFF